MFAAGEMGGFEVADVLRCAPAGADRPGVLEGRLRDEFSERAGEMVMTERVTAELPRLRAIDVCAGAGGWAVAASGLPIQIVAAVDVDEDCLATYQYNFPDVKCYQRDVVQWCQTDMPELEEIGPIDLVLGGIPCEQISAARRGCALSMEAEQSFRALVMSCLSIPDRIGAAYWCYEDVTDLIRYLPIFTPYFELDSSNFSAQRRKRVYVGNLGRPRTRGNNELLGDHLRRGPYRLSPRTKNRTPGRAFVYNSDQFYPWFPEEKSPTVINLNSRHDKYAAAKCGDGWRQLEWQELATLQGFPSDYVFVGNPTRTTQMIAQAVQIDTARAILEALCAEVFGEGGFWRKFSEVGS